jgi:hypothetical protein
VAPYKGWPKLANELARSSQAGENAECRVETEAGLIVLFAPQLPAVVLYIIVPDIWKGSEG